MTWSKEHTFVTHIDCQIDRCVVCDGGLAVCKVCGCAEGSLPTHCPGERVNIDAQDLIMLGKGDFSYGTWLYDGYPVTCLPSRLFRE